MFQSLQARGSSRIMRGRVILTQWYMVCVKSDNTEPHRTLLSGSWQTLAALLHWAKGMGHFDATFWGKQEWHCGCHTLELHHVTNPNGTVQNVQNMRSTSRILVSQQSQDIMAHYKQEPCARRFPTRHSAPEHTNTTISTSSTSSTSYHLPSSVQLTNPHPNAQNPKARQRHCVCHTLILLDPAWPFTA